MDDFDEDDEVQYGEEPWRPALVSGSLQQLQDLVQEHGLAILDRNVTDGYGTTPLLEAVRLEHVLMVRFLLEECSAVVDINAKCDEDDFPRWTSLHFATHSNNIELVRYVVEKGCDVNSVSLEGKSPLYMAAEMGYVDIVKFLIDSGRCNLDLETNDRSELVGPTALSRAVESCENNLEIVRYLLDRGPWSVAEKVDRASKALSAACQCGNLEIAKYLIESHQADANTINTCRPYYGKSPLLLACKRGSLELVDYLVEKCHVDVEAFSGDKWIKKNALITASESGHLDVVQYLVEKCAANVEATMGVGSTPLHLACGSGKLDVVQYLVEKCPALVETKEKKYGYTPLHEAVQRGNFDIVKYLAEKCPTNIEEPDKNGSTALHIAARGTRLEIVQHLVEKCGSDIEARNHAASTALHLACSRGDPIDIVKYLVEERRVNVNVPNNKGETALHTASDTRSIELVQCLVQTGRVNVNGVDINGQTAMHRCLLGRHYLRHAVDEAQQCLQIAKIFAGVDQANFETRDNDGRTVLHLACEKAVLPLVQYLVQEYRVDVNAASNIGETALHIASRQRHVEMVRCLVHSGRINVNATNTKGQTAMHSCLSTLGDGFTEDDGSKCYQIAKALASVERASFEAHDNNGRTILHMASEKDMFQLAQYLVQECRVDVNVVDDSLRTALHIATQHGRDTIVQYLVGLPQTNVNAADSNGCTPLHVSCAAASEEMPKSIFPIQRGIRSDYSSYWRNVQCLLKTDRVHVNAQDNQGKTALHHSFVHPLFRAAGHQRWQKSIQDVCFMIVQSLVESGQINVDTTDETGQTVLHYYCSFRNIDIPRYLIEQAHANVDVLDNEGRTALHIAASRYPRGTCARGGPPLVLFLVNRLSVDLVGLDDDHDAMEQRAPIEERLPKRQRM